MGSIYKIISGKLYGAPSPAFGVSADAYIGEIVSLGIRQVVSLEDSEPDEKIRHKLQEKGVGYTHVPVKDFTPPTDKDIEVIRRCYRKALKDGGALMIHCTAGLGRTGTAAAALLVAEEGVSAREAIGKVREARPGAIETVEQEIFVLKYAGRAARQKYDGKRRKKNGPAQC